MNLDNDINVWRFNIHTHNGCIEQMKTFQYCEEHAILGTGWRTQVRLMSADKEKIDNDEFYRRINQEKNSFNNPEGFKKAMIALRNMKKDDLIWTRKNNIYYLCRVMGTAKDFMEGERKTEIENGCYDIWHYVPCEFIKVGTEENVIGAIVRSFNMGVVCHIRGKGNDEIVKSFSKKTYNKFTGEDYYSYHAPNDKWKYFWDSMGALEIEEIVGLYMQMKLGYGIYTSTNKKDTKEYEYILFKRNTPKETAKLQVKTSNINLDEYNFGDKLFYFFTTEEYLKNGRIMKEKELKDFQDKNKVIILSKEELLEFAIENEKKGLLPYKLNWF